MLAKHKYIIILWWLVGIMDTERFTTQFVFLCFIQTEFLVAWVHFHTLWSSKMYLYI